MTISTIWDSDNSCLEMSDTLWGNGWLIRISSSDKISLFEVNHGDERYVRDFDKLIEAIEEGESWT